MKKITLLFIMLMLLLPMEAQNPRPADRDIYGWLYCHMSRKGEFTAFAISRDGVNFRDLNNGDEVYDTRSLSRIEGGARDAFISRAADGKGYVMVTTDMCVANSDQWYNYGIDLLRSDDLINWESTTFDFRQGPGIFCDPESPDVYRDYGAICRVWAPQTLWDPDYRWPDGSRGGYFIYYSLLNEKEDTYDRIFYSYADRSFTKLTKPQVLIDWGYATIDTDINYIKADKRFHILIKKEGGKPGIFTTSSKRLTGPYPEPDEKDFVNFEGKKKCEGPSAFQLPGEDTWTIAYVEYSSSPSKYRVCKADKYMRHFHSPADITGVADPQHGSFMPITKEEYERLEQWDRDMSRRADKSPKTAWLFAYSDNKGTGSLRLAWSVEGWRWNSIGDGQNFLKCAFGPWGKLKKMYNPRLLHTADGMWHCIWEATDSATVLAYTCSPDLTNWRPQQYFEPAHISRFMPAAYEPIAKRKVKIAGTSCSGYVQRVDFGIIKALEAYAAEQARKESQNEETTSQDSARFASLKPLSLSLSIDNKSPKPMSHNFLGIFFEDISRAADGGMYAELVQNRDFEYSPLDRP